MRYSLFEMERWQSTWEHRVRYNLSESGVHPLTVRELLALADREVDGDSSGSGEVGGVEGSPPVLAGSREGSPIAPETPLGGLADIRLEYGQSNGSDPLRAAIAELHPGATEASVLVTSGGAEANFVAAWHLLEPGEKLAALLPNYMQVPRLAESFGAEVLPVPLREEDAWQPDLDVLREALEAGARSILVTQPNNPTGASLSESAVKAIVSLAEEHGAWILADEVYRGAEVGGEISPTFWGRSARVLVTGSLSKAYGLPGLRIGWIVGPSEIVPDLWGRTDLTSITVSTLSDELARIALRDDVRRRILRRTRGIVEKNLAVLREWLDARPGLFAYRPPDAGAICYVRYDLPVNSTRLAETLRKEKSVLVVPGDHFGMDRYLRLGFGPPRHRLEPALDRIGEAMVV